MSVVDFTDVPTWSDADIKAQLIATRDKRYLTDNVNGGGSRRLSWLFPEDGCYARADQVRHLVVSDGGKTAPYKLFAFGSLRVYSNNYDGGVVPWGWHVVPVVKNSAGQPTVLDAALSPCQPLPWKEWLALMVDDISVYDNLLGGYGVTLGDPNAYGAWDVAIDGPDNYQRSLDDEQTSLLNREWQTQDNLRPGNRADVLGDHPPWGKGVCLSLVGKESSVAASATGSVAVSCPTGFVAVGGGYSSGSQSLIPYSSLLQSNGWSVSAKNSATSSNVLDAWAVCLSGTTGTVSSVPNSVSIAKKASGSISSTCPSGSVLTGGGFSVPSDQSIAVYKDWRKSASAWEVAGKNTSSSSKTLKSYATCLSGTDAATLPVSVQNTIPAGSGNSGGGSVLCTVDTLTTGGGWSASGANQSTYDSSMNPMFDGWTAYALNNTSSSQAFTTGAMCLSFNTVNDTNSGITYSGSWGVSSGRDLNDYMNDVHYTTTNADYFQYTFTGTGVDYVTEKNSDEGNVEVFIDGSSKGTFSCNNSTRLGQQVVYSKKNMSSGSHTIKVVKRSGSYMLLDALAIYK